MIRLAGSIEIAAPPEQVFDFLADLENAARWQSGVFDAHLITDPPLRVGSRFQESFTMKRRRFDAVCEMTSMDRPQAFAFRTVGSGTMSYEGAFNLVPTETGTSLGYTTSASLRGYLRFLEPLMRREALSESEAELERIRQAVESAPRLASR